DVVVDRPGRVAHAVQPGPLQTPGRAEAAGDGAWQEGPEALPQPGAGGILRGGGADVGAAGVLGDEVAVAALCEGDLTQPLLQAGALVTELVRGVDCDPADHAHRQRQTDAVDGR